MNAIEDANISDVKRNVTDIVCGIPDPEIPVLCLSDLGIIRDIDVKSNGSVVVFVTPTYTGCPAINFIEEEIKNALNQAGFEQVETRLVLSPAWTTDWISEAGKEKLLAYGIAPPQKTSNSKSALFGKTSVTCPRCNSASTEIVSEFGSTPCKALYRCLSCREPFDYFKCL